MGAAIIVQGRTPRTMMIVAYYNENDPYAAQWLRNLMAAGHIAPGYVDERSIVDVQPDDLMGYTQCHFFAGLGGWSHALRLAGWPDSRPVWTGSCPCQPFSVAGQQKGKNDERHLAPHWLELISQCRPSIIFGEQVEAAIRKDWLDDLQVHLEAEDYACGAIVLPACSVGSPHLRQRLWFVAERLELPGSERSRGEHGANGQQGRDAVVTRPARLRQDHRQVSADGNNSGSSDCGLADTIDKGLQGHGGSGKESISEGWTGADGYGSQASGSSGVADTGHMQRATRTPGNEYQPEPPVSEGLTGGGEVRRPGPTNGFWGDADWLFCRDGKWRPVESGTFPLAHGATARVGRLRAYGNAIVPQVAAEVIKAAMDVLKTHTG